MSQPSIVRARGNVRTVRPMNTDDRFADAIAFRVAHEVPWPRDPAAPARAGACTTTTRRRTTACAARCMRAGRSPGVVLAARPARSRPGASPIAPTSPSASPRPTSRCSPAWRTAQGLLPDEDEPVVARLPGIGFDDARTTAPITWTHLLTQTSEWEGTCFGLPDTVDRWRKVAQDPRPPPGRKGGARPLQRARHLLGIQRRAHQPARRWRCCTCSAGRCPRCSSSACCGRSAAATASPGAATTTPGSSCPASAACSRCRAARTGAAACRSARATRRASASCCSTAARTPAAQLIPRDWIERMTRAVRRSRRSTAGCSG